MKEKFDIYKVVTDKIVEQLEQGEIPWMKPWSGNPDAAINYVTRRPYSFLNQFLLGEEGEYLTYKQITEKGGKVKKGAKSRMVVFWQMLDFKSKKIDKSTGEEKEDIEKVPFLRYYNVFHIKDTEGIESKIKKIEKKAKPIEEAKKVIDNYLKNEPNLKFEEKLCDKAYFSPGQDYICVPTISQFDTANAFYGTAYHEMVHSTGVQKRLNRKDFDKGFFGNEPYAKEELVAEIGSAMLLGMLGIDTKATLKNSAAYIQSWKKAIRDDKYLIVSASGNAERAAQYILQGYNN